MLGGDGADELLAGLSDLHGRARRRSLPTLAAAGQALAGAAVGGCRWITAISASTSSSSNSSGARPSRCRWPTSAGSARSPAPRSPGCWSTAIRSTSRREHLRRAEALDGGSDPLSRSLALYQDTYLPEDILTKVDRASMACGLEVRAPFLDAELVDFMQVLPPSFKFGRNQTKRLLKRAAASRLPASILARPKKGFGIPVAAWLRGPLAPLMTSSWAASAWSDRGCFVPTRLPGGSANTSRASATIASPSGPS